MMRGLKYNYSGVTIIVVRLLFAIVYLYNVNHFKVDVWTEPGFLIHLSLCVLEFFSTLSLLFFPRLTCKGNGYLRCLPFLFTSLAASFSSLFVPLGLLEDHVDYTRFQYPEGDRMPLVTSAFIFALIMYGGIASPLKLTWTQVFKPFVSIEEPKPRRRSTRKSSSAVKSQ